MMHSQIVLGFYMILFNSNPTTHGKRAKQKKEEREKEALKLSSRLFSGAVRRATRKAMSCRWRNLR
jgi:hypothetical protein